MTVTERLYFIADMYVKSRDNPEHQHHSQPMREKNLYWTTLSRIGQDVLSVSQRQFSSYLCKYNNRKYCIKSNFIAKAEY